MKILNIIFLCVIFLSILLGCKDESKCDLTVEVGFQIPHNYVTALTNGGQEPYTFIWSDGSTNGFIPFDSTVSIYSVTVTDFDGCIDADTLNLNECPLFFGTPILSGVNINGRCWLNAEVFDTIAIPQVTDPAEWANLTSPGWCYYENDDLFRFIYGKLYNWYAVNSGKLCPQGFHVPTKEEWQSLVDFLGGDIIAGKEMKESFLWNSPFVGTDMSDFDAKPSGKRLENGTFINKGYEAHFWTSTESSTDTSNAISRAINNSSTQVFLNESNKNSGFSCRCVKDN